METFEHSKAKRRDAKRKIVAREIKIVVSTLAVGMAVFFINGGFTSLFWASFSGAVAAALVGGIAHYSLD